MVYCLGMHRDTLRGPYVSENMDILYLRASDWTYGQARSEAAKWAAEFIDYWGRSRYTGKRDVPLHDHGEWEGCEECPAVPAWCFDIYEGSLRK